MRATQDGAEGWPQTGGRIVATVLAADLGEFVGVLSAQVVQGVSGVDG